MIPRPPTGTVRVEKPITVGVNTVWVLTTHRFTELQAIAFLKQHPTYRRHQDTR